MIAANAKAISEARECYRNPDYARGIVGQLTDALGRLGRGEDPGWDD